MNKLTKLQRVTQGLNTFLELDINTSIGTDRNLILVPFPKDRVPEELKLRLDALGWRWNENFESWQIIV